MKLSAKFKKILWSKLRATFNNSIIQKFKVALNPLHKIFLTLQRVLSWPADYFCAIKKMGSPISFFRYKQLKPKYRVFLQGFPVAMVTCYVSKMTASCSTIIIDVSHGTIALLLCDKVLL